MALDGGALSSAAPSTFAVAAMGGAEFTSPTDAVSSPDGTQFYFAAFTMEGDAALFRVPAVGGAVTTLHRGAPLVYPSGLVLSCDGATLYVADTQADTDTTDDADGTGSVLSISVEGGTPSALGTGVIAAPNALAMGPDCQTLAVSARTADGAPAVFRARVDGSTPTVLAVGAPLVAPSGVHVDPTDVAWVMDHLAEGEDGPGVLFQIPTDGAPSIVVSGLILGTPAGVSLTAGGGNAVISGRDESGAGTLTVVNLGTGATSETMLPTGFVDPAGLRTARSAPIFALVDSEGSAIYRGM